MSNFTNFQRKIQELLPNIRVSFNEPLSRHTSFRIGGPAEVMVFPETREQLAEVLKISALLDQKLVILGAGTNVLAPDEGIMGIVVCLRDALRELTAVGENSIYAAAGVSMAKAALFAANLGLSGMEFAHGIPGSIGGGIFMNAGAYGGELSGICRFVDIMDSEGRVRRVSGGDMGFGYRKSCIEGTGDIVLGAEFSLEPGDPAMIREKMQELQQRRRTSQPLEYPSAGSAFKRPAGGYAAALIDQAGLKGYRVGGAAVSEKHAGFVVNLGGATAAEVRSLLCQVSDIVFDKFGIRLEPEIRIL